MKKFVFVFLAVLVGLAVAFFRITGLENSKAFFHNGSWTGSNALPLGKSNLLTTQVTLFGLFALPSDEAIYLFARKDENNEFFTSDYNYTIEGNTNDIKAKYWSITIYGKDLFLIDNEINRFSYNNSNIQKDSAGNFTITVSAIKQNGNWLPSKKDSRFNLVLRIYKGEKDFISKLSEVSLPVIKRKPNGS